MSVVVVGNTGAGKSTLINSLLGEANVLPTNGMRACTAVLIHMSYPKPEKEGDAPTRQRHHHGSGGGAAAAAAAAYSLYGPAAHADPQSTPASSTHVYNGAVSFVSKKEWELELGDLMDDLTQQDGKAILSVADPKARNYTSWCKVYAVYGDAFTKSRIKIEVKDGPNRCASKNTTSSHEHVFFSFFIFFFWFGYAMVRHPSPRPMASLRGSLTLRVCSLSDVCIC